MGDQQGIGFYDESAYDFEGRPYASYLVLSRRKLDDKEYYVLLEKDLNKFYIYPTKENK